jgi:hypothetical protein
MYEASSVAHRRPDALTSSSCPPPTLTPSFPHHKYSAITLCLFILRHFVPPIFRTLFPLSRLYCLVSFFNPLRHNLNSQHFHLTSFSDALYFLSVWEGVNFLFLGSSHPSCAHFLLSPPTAYKVHNPRKYHFGYYILYTLCIKFIEQFRKCSYCTTRNFSMTLTSLANSPT